MTKLQTGVSFTKYMSLYTMAYKYCASSKMPSNTSEPSVAGRSGANLRGSDLYNNLIHYFVQHFRHLREHSDTLQNGLLLKYYSGEWDRYTTGAGYINRLFTYLNRHWVKRERDEGRKGVYPVYTLALVQWHHNFFLHIQGKQPNLTGTILRLVEQQRNGETVDQGLVKKVIDSFVSLGIDETDLNKVSLSIYKEHFEIPFLNATEAYYKLESDSFLAENNLSDYLNKAEERLKEEEDRVGLYLHKATRKFLISKCEDILVRMHAELMWDSFQSLLDYDKDQDLRRMYSLLSRIPEGLEPLRRKFEEHVKRTGLAAIAIIVGTDSAAIDELDQKLDLTAYVDALLEVHTKYSDTVNHIFGGEAGFVASFDRACREFVNRNAVTRRISGGSPELLATHADALLRKNNKMANKSDLEGSLNRVMIIFKYLEEKDVFQRFYSTKLSKRLIHGLSESDEAEASMISKLKEACGFKYAIKLQRMFTDISLSQDLTESFKEHVAQSQNHADMKITFSVMILGTNFWPLSRPKGSFTVPTDIRLSYDLFQKFYQRTRPDRTLAWLWDYSKNELQTTYLSRKYIFMTSTYQMTVLLEYNNRDSLSLDELGTATNVERDVLMQVLQPLVKSGILISERADQYDLNLHFESKKIRVNLNQPTKAEVKAELNDVLKIVDEYRIYIIRAAIVRTMKARKTMENESLIQEVASELSKRFTPKVPAIMKAIEMLLEQEYIKRVDGTQDTKNPPWWWFGFKGPPAEWRSTRVSRPLSGPRLRMHRSDGSFLGNQHLCGHLAVVALVDRNDISATTDNTWYDDLFLLPLNTLCPMADPPSQPRPALPDPSPPEPPPMLLSPPSPNQSLPDEPTLTPDMTPALLADTMSQIRTEMHTLMKGEFTFTYFPHLASTSQES
ncbi:Cullin-domain-containing protein [Lactifluus volemus]|nr:Cullin-domain-containing protein [Lactifluus volemus]